MSNPGAVASGSAPSVSVPVLHETPAPRGGAASGPLAALPRDTASSAWRVERTSATVLLGMLSKLPPPAPLPPGAPSVLAREGAVGRTLRSSESPAAVLASDSGARAAMSSPARDGVDIPPLSGAPLGRAAIASSEGRLRSNEVHGRTGHDVMVLRRRLVQ